MQNLTPIGQNIVNDISARYQLSYDAVVYMLGAVNSGGGTMAQFNCPELGGGGQWMQGGMTMAGDMFNHGLKNTIDNLCNELSSALANNTMYPIIPAGSSGSSQWWPQDLGIPFSSGGQNDSRYAIFANRLAVETQGNVVVYDTLDHQIGGVSQQQGSNESLSFNSQYGTFTVASLPVLSGNVHQDQYSQISEPTAPLQQVAPTNTSSYDTIELLKQLGQLRDAGVLSNAEFEAKKHELMARI